MIRAAGLVWNATFVEKKNLSPLSAAIAANISVLSIDCRKTTHVKCML
jgi:hypothetical protein